MKVCLIFPPVYLPIEGTKLTPPFGDIFVAEYFRKKWHYGPDSFPLFAGGGMQKQAASEGSWLQGELIFSASH